MIDFQLLWLFMWVLCLFRFWWLLLELRSAKEKINRGGWLHTWRLHFICLITSLSRGLTLKFRKDAEGIFLLHMVKSGLFWCNWRFRWKLMLHLGGLIFCFAIWLLIFRDAFLFGLACLSISTNISKRHVYHYLTYLSLHFVTLWIFFIVLDWRECRFLRALLLAMHNYVN